MEPLISPSEDAYAALRVPAFRRYLGMRLGTTLAVQIMSVAVGYFIYDLTGDPLMLGLTGLTEAVPAISISLWAGHLADKYKRRNILAVCLSMMVLCTTCFFLLAYYRHELSRETLLAGVYSVIFVIGIARGFFSPTNFAFLPQLVDKKTLANAISWNSSTWEVASVTGLGLGGLLYGFAGIAWTAAVIALLMALALVFLLAIAPRPAPAFDHRVSALHRIREGLRFVYRNQVIFSTIALDLFAVLFGGAVALLPVFAKDILQVGPQGLGLLRAATSLGAISVALYLAHRPLRGRVGLLMLGCVACFGLCILVFGLSRWLWLSFVCLYLSGVFDGVSVYIRAYLVQRLTPDHLKGRVSSVNSIFVTSSNELGAFESGLTAKWMGTVPAVLFGGFMTLAVVAFTWWKAPKLRNLDFRQLQEETEDNSEYEV